jgi:hypothetical protein
MGGAGGAPVDPPAQDCAAPPRRIWRLTPEQYSRSVQAVLPAVLRAGDAIANSLAVSSDAFSNEAAAMTFTGPHVNQILQSAFSLARTAAGEPARLLPCLGQTPVARACLEELVGGYGGRAFRRTLAADEIQRLADFVARQPTTAEGVKQLFLYLFASPQFLFRTELGPDRAGPVPMTSFEKASALSYFLTDGPPDATLFAAARDGALETGAQLEAAAKRLLASPEAAPGLVRLMRESFRTDAVTGAQKDATVFPAWTPALAADLATEAERFLGQVVWREGGKLSTLLTADFSMGNDALAAFYGVPDRGPGFHKLTFPPGQRAGLLTQAGLLATQAIADEGNPVRRGLYVRELVMCQEVPAPPADLNVVLPPQDGQRQWRERLKSHSADPRCASCHSQMDAIGLGFEHYDGIGRYRDKDLNRPLDTAGVLTGLASGDAPFRDAVELARLLAAAPEVRHCFVGRALRYAQGRHVDELHLDRCTLQRLGKRFDDSGGDVLDLAVALTTDPSFTERQ